KDYTVTLHTATGTITAAVLDIYATSHSKTYDGTKTDTATSTFQVSGEPVSTLYNSDTLTGLVQAFDSKDVLGTGGSTLRVQAGYAVNDGNSGNDYAVTLHTATGTITAAGPAIYPTSHSKTYDGTKSDTATPTFQVSGEPVSTLYNSDTLTGLVQAFDSKDVLGTGGSTLRVQ